jgi:hypothetical protein
MRCERTIYRDVRRQPSSMRLGPVAFAAGEAIAMGGLARKMRCLSGVILELSQALFHAGIAFRANCLSRSLGEMQYKLPHRQSPPAYVMLGRMEGRKRAV